jgi:DNA-binding response OmpR family regulator
LVEDDVTLRETLQYNLSNEGYEVVAIGDGSATLEMVRSHTPDLVVLDVMLPGLDGFTICRLLRQESDVPVVIVTARSAEVDRIIGLELGADDYIVKPFGLGEFLARVRAALRRSPNTQNQNYILKADSLVVDVLARRVTRNDREVNLSHKEFDLLVTLMRNRGAVLSRDLLLERVWGYGYDGQTKTVDVHVRWLREKIEDNPSEPKHIVTVRGVGYRFEG